jgi:hypothetical protein
MKDLDAIKSRYFKESFERRLGHLASDLVKITSFLDNPKNTAAINDIIEESKFFIEWNAPEAPSHLQEFFADIQPRLALWQRHLEKSEAKQDLKKSAKEWSDRLLKFSGLLA